MAAPGATGQRSVGRILPDRCIFFLCDMQEKFRSSIEHFEGLVAIAQRMVKAAGILKIPVVVTEQYPKGLGKTVDKILEDNRPAKVYEKTLFSMMTPEVIEYLGTVEGQRKSVVIFGIEAHICVLQSAHELVQRGFEVHVLADGCSSRQQSDRKMAFERMQQNGVFVTTSEAVVFELLRDATHPNFKEVQKLIKVSPPDTGL